MNENPCPHHVIDGGGRCEWCSEVVETVSKPVPRTEPDAATLEKRFNAMLGCLDKANLPSVRAVTLCLSARELGRASASGHS